MSAHQSILHPGDVCDCGRRATHLTACKEPECDVCRVKNRVPRGFGHIERVRNQWRRSAGKSLRWMCADAPNCYHVCL